MFDDILGGGFEPPPFHPDDWPGDDDQSFQQWAEFTQAEFDEFVRDAQKELDRVIRQAAESWLSEEGLREREEALQEAQEEGLPYPFVRGLGNLPPGKRARAQRYATPEDAVAQINTLGLSGYSPVLVALESGLWTWALDSAGGK